MKGVVYTGATKVSEENGTFTDHTMGILVGVTAGSSHVTGHIFEETAESTSLEEPSHR